MTRTPEEEQFITRITMVMCAVIATVIVLPVLAILGGVAWRLCKAVAGE